MCAERLGRRTGARLIEDPDGVAELELRRVPCIPERGESENKSKGEIDVFSYFIVKILEVRLCLLDFRIEHFDPQMGDGMFIRVVNQRKRRLSSSLSRGHAWRECMRH